MPFKSEAQRKYLWANEPGIARDWTDKHGSRIHKAGGGIGQLVQPGPGRPGYRGPQDWGEQERAEEQAAKTGTAGSVGTGSYAGMSHQELQNLAEISPSHGGIGQTSHSEPEKTIREKIIERVDNSRQKSINSFVHRNKKKNLNRALDYGLIDKLKGRGIDDDEVDYFDVDDIRNLYAGGADPKGLAGLRKDLEFEEKFKDTKPTQTQFEEYYGLNKPPDTGGGGGEEIPWWLRQQAPVGSTPIKEEEVASNDLGEGHF